MAYNLQSLITILEQILKPQQTCWIVNYDNIPHLRTLLEKAASLQQILKNTSLPILESLECQIRDASYQAEDIIESHLVDARNLKPEDVILALDVQQPLKEFDLVMEQVVKLVEEVKAKKIMASGSSSLRTDAASVSSSSKSASVVVGVDADVLKLQDRLAGMQKKLEIIPIVGMGGIGKTTLALNLYEDPLIVYHFKYLAWSTISQDHNTQAILSDLIGKENIVDWDDLYKSLYGRRYMIVLDDMWSTQAWDEIRMYFPDNNNGSRIVITTRESDVAKCAGSLSLQHEVQLLDKSESWNLLRQIVFGDEEDCPHSFQDIGEKIVMDCGGLPLAIKVIGGLLSKVQRSIDDWENIGNDVRAAIAESDEHVQVSNILSLSYNHLPNHLKPCFLYMAAFPEDHEIKTSSLIHVWVAEGFMNSNIGDKSLEEEAKDCIKGLAERNLLLVSHYKNGKPDRYKMHDLLRDLCIKKAAGERFLHVKNYPEEVTFSNPRRVIYHTRTQDYQSADLYSMPLARSFRFIDWVRRESPSAWLLVLRLLRVLDVWCMAFEEFPREIFQLVNLRYLAFWCGHLTLPVGISRLRNLQTLIAGEDKIDEPSEIWQLSELRYLKFRRCSLLKYAGPNDIVQKNLQTVFGVSLTPSLLESDFFKSIPNIKKLGLYHDSTEKYIAVDFTHLHKLETLTVSSEGGSLFMLGVEFPSSLRKLTLIRCAIPVRLLTTLCALPNLEVLEIVSCDFEREEWEAAEGDAFRSLQFLSLERCKLVHWGANETNFPRLRHLHLKKCMNLQEIPSAFGEIITLQLIVLEFCSDSAVDSAKQIQKLQQSDYDNYDLQLRIWTANRTQRLFGKLIGAK